MYTKERTSNRRITLFFFFNLSLAAWSERKYHIRSVSKGFSQSGERGGKEGEREKKKKGQGFGRRKNCDRKRTTLDLFFVRRKKKKRASLLKTVSFTPSIRSTCTLPRKKRKQITERELQALQFTALLYQCLRNLTGFPLFLLAHYCFHTNAECAKPKKVLSLRTYVFTLVLRGTLRYKSYLNDQRTTTAS